MGTLATYCMRYCWGGHAVSSYSQWSQTNVQQVSVEQLSAERLWGLLWGIMSAGETENLAGGAQLFLGFLSQPGSSGMGAQPGTAASTESRRKCWFYSLMWKGATRGSQHRWTLLMSRGFLCVPQQPLLCKACTGQIFWRNEDGAAPHSLGSSALSEQQTGREMLQPKSAVHPFSLVL